MTDSGRGAPPAPLLPTPPVVRTDLPRDRVCGLSEPLLKAQPEDFVVEEVPAYRPTGEGTHRWLWIEKRGVATLQLVGKLATAFGISPRAIGYAGLKDASAITRQALTVPGDVDLPDSIFEELGVRVLESVPTRNKLKIGHLRGNRFDLVVRGGFAAEQLTSVRDNLDFLCRHGAPNSFGEQRFGTTGDGVDRGMRLLRADDPRRAVRRAPKGLGRLWVGAVQSEVFNRVLAARVERYGANSLGRVVLGDVAWLHRNGACFSIESDVDVSESVPRAEEFEISPTGPMPGPKTKTTTGEVASLEQEVVEELGLRVEWFAALGAKLAQGVRRPLRVPVEDPRVEFAPDPDTGGALRLAFTLPRGAYATVVVRQLVAGIPWFG